jgi:hypothetical protein
MTKAKYVLKTAGKVAKEAAEDGAAILGCAATYLSMGSMPREWAEWSHDKLGGEGYFKKHEDSIAFISGLSESAEAMCLGAVIGREAMQATGSYDLGMVGMAYLACEGMLRAFLFPLSIDHSAIYKSNLPSSLLSKGVKLTGKGARKFGNYVSDIGTHISDIYREVVEADEGKEKGK